MDAGSSPVAVMGHGYGLGVGLELACHKEEVDILADGRDLDLDLVLPFHLSFDAVAAQIHGPYLAADDHILEAQNHAPALAWVADPAEAQSHVPGPACVREPTQDMQHSAHLDRTGKLQACGDLDVPGLVTMRTQVNLEAAE